MSQPDQAGRPAWYSGACEESFAVPGREVAEWGALGDQVVGYRLRLGVAERQSADHDLIVGDLQLAAHDVLHAAERRLWAGVQALLARQQHQLVEEDAAVDPLPAAHAPLDAQ